MNAHSFLATPVYTIAAGPKRKEFPVHSGLLSSSSETLRMLVASRRGTTIVWEQFDEETVGRFVQWLYTREYQVPAPKRAALPASGKFAGFDTRQPRPTSRVFAEAMASSFMPSPPSTPSPACSVLSDAGFSPASTPPTTASSSSSAPPHSRPGTADSTTSPVLTTDPSAPLDYEEPFLAHAKMYALAQFTDITALKLRSINRLAALLDEIRWLDRSSAAADNFVKLARYVYEHTDTLCRGSSGSSSSGGSNDRREESLRVVVTSFAAFNFERLDCPAMMALMAEGGDFVTDVVKKVMKTMRKPAVSAPPSPSPSASPTRAASRQRVLIEAMKQMPPPGLEPKASAARFSPSPAPGSRKVVKARPVVTKPCAMAPKPPVPTAAATTAARKKPVLEKKPLPQVEKKPTPAPPSPAPQPTMRRTTRSTTTLETLKQQSSSNTAPTNRLQRKPTSISRIISQPERKPSLARLSFGK